MRDILLDFLNYMCCTLFITSLYEEIKLIFSLTHSHVIFLLADIFVCYLLYRLLLVFFGMTKKWTSNLKTYF